MPEKHKSFSRRFFFYFLTLALVVSTLSAISVFAPLQTSFANQITQSSFDFNTGTPNQVMKTANNAGPIPASSNFSVESWVYIDSDTGSWQTIMSQNQPSTSCCTGRFYMGFPAGRNLHIGFETGYTDVAVIPTTTWTHIALTLQRDTPSAGLTTTKTYINGDLVQNKTDWPNNTFSSGNGFSVGSATDGGYKLDGKIDQVKVWNGVLSQADVKKSMSTYAAGGISTGTLRAHYDFNEGTGNTITDRSGISANLTVNDGVSAFSQTPTPPVTTPAAPTLGTATVTNATTVSIPFTAGAANGSAITSYTITSSPSIVLTYSGTTSPFTVTGSFVEGQAYTFTMTATNGAGTSSPSSASNSITPNTAAAPTLSSAVLNSAGTSIVLTYNETLSATTAATSAFAVSDSGTAVTVSSVTASGFAVTLALASTINTGRVVTVSYTDPTGSDDANAIQDSVGNDAISLASRSVTNNSTVKATPTFSSWSNVAKTFGDANYTVTAPTVTGSIPGTFSYSSSNTGVISISGTTFTVQGGGSATITATFTPTDTTNYNSASTTNTVTVSRATPTFSSWSNVTKGFGDANYTVAAPTVTGSIAGTFSYSSSNTGVISISGTTFTVEGVGSATITATFTPTNATNYNSATTTNTVTVGRTSVSASLTLAPGNLVFRQAKNITAVATVAGKVTFRVAGKILPGCKNRTVNAGNSFTAICSYRPSTRGDISIAATLDPTDASYIGTTTTTSRYFVGNRTGPRS